MSLAHLHEHAACMLDASPSPVSCSIHPSGYLGMMVQMGWTPLHQKMHSAVAVHRIHMLSHLYSQAESSLLAVANVNSPVSGWRAGSTHTAWHTSDSRPAVRSRISLWCMIGNPPVGHFRVWSMVNDLPQAHVVGKSGGCHPYLRQIASRKAPLQSENPWLSMGSTTAKLEDPFSFATSISFWSFGGSCGWRLLTVAICAYLFSLLTFTFHCCCWTIVSELHCSCCSIIYSIDKWCCDLQQSTVFCWWCDSGVRYLHSFYHKICF